MIKCGEKPVAVDGVALITIATKTQTGPRDTFEENRFYFSLTISIINYVTQFVVENLYMGQGAS